MHADWCGMAVCMLAGAACLCACWLVRHGCVRAGVYSMAVCMTTPGVLQDQRQAARLATCAEAL